jgi:hypothetical protein
MEKHNRPSLDSFYSNLKKPMPLGRKVKLFLKNWLKIRRWDTCCGHPGEPGC